MFSLGASQAYYLYREPTDMRKSFDGLAGLVRSQMKANPLNGSVYIFINKRRDRIKLLHWETGGFTLYYKRLEKGQFELPITNQSACKIQWSELMMIVEGIQLKHIKRRPRFSLS